MEYTIKGELAQVTELHLAKGEQRMIELYRPADCPICAEIEAALEEMVVAYRTIVVEPEQRPAALEPETPLPAIKDDGQIISGQAAITTYLRELEKFVADWRLFQTDACYIFDDEEAC